MVNNEGRNFQVEYFYYGTLIQDGQAVSKPGIILTTPGIRSQQVQDALRAYRLAPPSTAQSSSEMPSSLGLFRDEAGTYIFIKAQRTAEGYPQLMYWFMLPELIQRMSGNFTIFESVGFEDMPSAAEPRRDLRPHLLDNAAPLADADQIEYLYDLYFYCGDKSGNVEGLLSAIIHNRPVAILNAPPSLQTRLGFIQGLLHLLPPPARMGMTWITSVEQAEDVRAHIKFLTRLANPPGHVIYDWAAGELLTDAPGNRYSKFITQQLRLDASLVVETTNNIARTTTWRAMRKESLPDALEVVSRRAAVDSAVLGNQPAERSEIAAILRQDPTLSEELRVLYAQHLLSLELALNDLAPHADVIPIVAAANQSVANATYYQLRDAIEYDDPLKVLYLVERWITNVPQAGALPWHQLAHLAAKTFASSLMEAGATQDYIDFLNMIVESDSRMQYGQVITDLIAEAQAAAASDSTLGMAIFLLAAERFPAASFQKILANAALVSGLPDNIRVAASYLEPTPRSDPPLGLLRNAVDVLDERQRLIVMVRFTELALQLRRAELLDGYTLQVLLDVSESRYSQHLAPLISSMAQEFGQAKRLVGLDKLALELLPQLMFIYGHPDVGVRLLERTLFDVYTLENLEEYVELAGRTFLPLALPYENFQPIHAAMENTQIHPEARARAYCAVLIGVKWHPSYRDLACFLSDLIYQDFALSRVLGLENLLRLLAFHTQDNDVRRIKSNGYILVDRAANIGDKGPALLIRAWEVLQKNPKASGFGLELLRQYVRLAEPGLAYQLPPYFDQYIGSGLGHRLHATFIMRQIMGDYTLVEYSEIIRIAVAFLIDVAATYRAGVTPPTQRRLQGDLDSMGGGLSEEDRANLGANLDYIARAVYIIGNQQPQGRNAANIEVALFQNKSAPDTAWDMLVYLSGFFSEYQTIPLDLSRESPAHVFGIRSAVVMRDEVPLIAWLFERLQNTLTQDAVPKLQPEALKGELQSLWNRTPLYDQRQIKQQIQTDFQFLSQVITLLCVNVSHKIFSNRGLDEGKDVPRNGLEALRWASGYFNRTHQRR